MTHRVLSTPELLDRIFGFLGEASNSKNACVCKTWSNIALDLLWKDVELQDLFSLLAPLVEVEDSGYIFSKLPTATSWKRFELYGSRVQLLTYMEPEFSGMKLLQSIFDEVASTRLNSTILPNMHTLTWQGPRNASVIFMHPSVKTFKIWLPENGNEAYFDELYFDDVTIRMPNLVKLSLLSNDYSGDYENVMIDFVTRLPNLQAVTFPRFPLTTKLLEALSMLPNIAKIDFQPQAGGYVDARMAYAPVLAQGAFPVLQEFSQAAYFDNISSFFTVKFAPKDLTLLHVESDLNETSTSFQGLVVAVADHCQLLEKLVVVSYRGGKSLNTLDDNDEHKISFNHLKPLLNLPNLKFLEIRHHIPVALKHEDLELLAVGLPSLEALDLNSEPGVIMQSDLSLEALFLFACHCPKLTKLGLFVNTTNLKLPSTSPTIVPFKRLECLNVGASIIHDDNPVALYLSRLLPVGCTVAFKLDEADWHPNLAKKIKLRRGRWQRVNKLLPFFIQAREEERERKCRCGGSTGSI